MTAPPLPESPCVRVRLDYTQSDGLRGGNRFYLGYTGSSPTTANLDTLASDIEASWTTRLAPVTHQDWALTEVDILDIASLTGASGTWTGSSAGSLSGDHPTANDCLNVEFDIARRYRGGKPRIFLPVGVDTDLADQSHWQDTFASGVATFVSDMFADIAALAIGSMGTLRHVNVSYYQGFTNVTNSSGRTRAAPKYRSPTALVEDVTGYVGKTVVGSQRRRRTSTTY